MRIISGKAGSIPLQVPKSLTRPTTDRVREAVFSSLGAKLIDSVVLDLFAGCGSLGLESLSRGAASATLVDSARRAVRAIETNLAKTKLEGARVVQRDALSFAGTLAPASCDLIFADPPYARDEETSSVLERLLTLERLPPALREDGYFILESLSSRPLPETDLWKIVKEKSFGTTRVSFLIPASAPTP
jgi:16S rRNA (guanine966-N2)-methyltransferase